TCRLPSCLALWCERLEPGRGGLGDRGGVPKRSIPPIVDLGKDAAYPFLEFYLLTPAQITLNFAYVGPRTVRLAGPFGAVGDGAAQQLEQPVDRLRVAGSEVPDLAGFGGFGGGQEGRGHVGDVEKVARLGAVAHHRERFAGELLL